jgi:predicted PurR-regulated permease PerM
MKLFNSKKTVQQVEVTISNNTIVRVLVIIVGFVLAVRIFEHASSALVLVFMSFFLALALNAPVHWIGQHWPGKRRGSRVVATSISYLVVVAALITFLTILVPPAAKQVTSFVQSAPTVVRSLQDQESALGTFIRENNLEGFIDDISKEISTVAKSSGSAAVSTVTAVGSSIVSLFVMLTMTFMMLVEGPRWLRLVKRLLPLEHRAHATKLATDMYGVVRGFVNGQVTLALIAAFMILPVMLIMNVPYAGALAVIVFICGLIPMIGHFIGASIVTVIALFTSPLAALVVLSYYILYQQIENYVVQPRIQANTTNLSPLLVFVALTIGVSINGVVGGIVAIPVMGCTRILVIDYLQRSNRLKPIDTKKQPEPSTA